MEGLIILIISLIAAALTNKGKAAKQQSQSKPKSQPKPFTAETRPQPQGKSLRDLSREMVRDLQKELERSFGEETNKNQWPNVDPMSRRDTTEKKSRPSVEHARASSALQEASPSSKAVNKKNEGPVHSGRLSTHGGRINTVQTGSQSDIFPRTQNELLRGIIFSEVIGKPKSKQ